MIKQGIYFCLLACSLILTSCNSDGVGNSGSASSDGKASLSGTITNASNLKVFVDHVTEPNSNMSIQSTSTDENGNFSFNFENSLDPGIYKLRIGSKKGFLILNGDEKNIKIEGDLSTLNKNDFTISGSPGTEEYNQAFASYLGRKLDVAGIQNFAANSKNPFAGAQLAMQTLKLREDFVAVHKIAASRIAQKYGDIDFSKKYNATVAGLEQKLMLKQSREKIKVGAPAPNITAKSPDGKEYSLEDLKGQVVLLDFWASWCGPCRKANPHVVETYKKYKNKGFTVFSVSLDGVDSRTAKRYPDQSQLENVMNQQKTRWVKAIEKDKLEWDYHVSNLKKWEEPAARQYGVTGIPKTFLIDKEGKIAAVNPRYDLEEQLKKLL